MGIDIRPKCEIDCRLKYITKPEHTCSLCKHYEKIDIPKLIEEIFKLKAKADEEGKIIEYIYVKNDKILSIIYNTIWDETNDKFNSENLLDV